jgi:hypothetical protein
MPEQVQAWRFRRTRHLKHTVAWRGNKQDIERIELVFRKYHVPWGISRSSRFRALFRILAAGPGETQRTSVVAALEEKWKI